MDLNRITETLEWIAVHTINKNFLDKHNNTPGELYTSEFLKDFATLFFEKGYGIDSTTCVVDHEKQFAVARYLADSISHSFRLELNRVGAHLEYEIVQPQTKTHIRISRTYSLYT
jgi:hypothetical protein